MMDSAAAALPQSQRRPDRWALLVACGGGGGSGGGVGDRAVVVRLSVFSLHWPKSAVSCFLEQKYRNMSKYSTVLQRK